MNIHVSQKFRLYPSEGKYVSAEISAGTGTPALSQTAFLEKLGSITEGTLETVEVKHCPHRKLILHHLFSDYQYQTVQLDPVAQTFCHMPRARRLAPHHRYAQAGAMNEVFLAMSEPVSVMEFP